MAVKQTSAAKSVADRLCRAQHIGLFGHRGAGKTTFLTMLYREAVGGRLQGLRLASGDARTATYLADKILQLEEGEPLPATLGETELRFHLYHGNSRFDLVVKDYQGEHVALGREEPIRDFLRDCDAVWLCLDVAVAETPGECLRSQQEVEQLVEDYLGSEHPDVPTRPMSLVLTKADLLPQEDAEQGPVPDPSAITELVDQRFGMTRHALAAHAPEQHAFLAVSSLGKKLVECPEMRDVAAETSLRPTFELDPRGLAEPLLWLADALRAQDMARMNYLWKVAGNDPVLLNRCIGVLRKRYPDDPEVKQHQRRLTQLRRTRFRRRLTAAVIGLAALVLGLWSYDAVAKHNMYQLEKEHGNEPALVWDRWQSYQKWHPTRHLLRPAAKLAEEEHLRELGQRVRHQQAEQRLAELRQQATDPDVNPEAIWTAFLKLREEYPEHPLEGDLQKVRAQLHSRRAADRERRAKEAVDELIRSEQQTELTELVARGEKLLDEYGDTEQADTLRDRLKTYLYRIDERDIQVARTYSARQPFSFHTRREHYQKYLERHPEGVFLTEATQALETIEKEWDKHDFRAVRDHFQRHPSQTTELELRCQTYLAAHPEGRFVETARELLRWCEQVVVERPYRITLRRGSFDADAAHLLSRGLHLSVEVEVNGVIYGPSTIVKRSSEPEWNYEFPTPVRWKLGYPVHIRVTDNYYWKRSVTTFSSAEDDPLAMRMLSGTVSSGKNSIVFDSSFQMPVMPRIE